jgi:hypothetical protein
MSEVRLYSKADFSECQLTKHPLYSYIQEFFSQELSELVENSTNGTCYALEVGQKLCLVVVAQFQEGQTYPTSLRAQYLDYAQEELALTDMKGKRLLSGAFQLLKRIIPKTIDEVVYVGNYLLSTNLFQSFTTEELQNIESLLQRHFPTKTIVYRSQNSFLNRQLMENLSALNYQSFISRQVFIAHQSQVIQQKKTFKKDRKLAKDTTFNIRTNFDVTNYSERIIELYTQLYISKYSQINPRYTPAFIEAMKTVQNTYFTGVFDEEKLIGVTMSWELDGTLTVPILGYDLSYPKESGIYRLLTYYTLLRVNDEQLFHMSSGVGPFKLSRGAEYFPEYIYYKRPASAKERRFSFWLLQKLNTVLTRMSNKRAY